jgi:membrane protease YdiL (CAAX protease family)
MLKTRSKNAVFVIVTAVVAVIMLYISDQIIALNYLGKSLLKILLFTVFSFIYTLRTGENTFMVSFQNARKKSSGTLGKKVSILLGLAVFIVIIAAFFILQGYIQTEILVKEFEDKYRINASNIAYYGLYLALFNSFLEEFFFRGFIFLNLKRLGYRKLAYLTSALLFSVYHIANFQNWLHMAVFILALLGLAIGGCIFNYLDEKQETFFNSWFVHICADLAIVAVGFRIFGLI